MASSLIALHKKAMREQQSILYEKENQNDSGGYYLRDATGIHNAFIPHLLKTEAKTKPQTLNYSDIEALTRLTNWVTLLTIKE